MNYTANARPSPPSSRPMRLMPRPEELPAAPEPPPAPEAAEVAGKKKRARSPESIAKMKATIAAKKAGAKRAAEESVEPAFDGLDLILDIIELCERAKKGLSKSQRVRLRAALNERLS